jgi:hypothetical protein
MSHLWGSRIDYPGGVVRIMSHAHVHRIEPIVRHGLNELSQGAPIEHVLCEVALISAMVGEGLPLREAIAKFERNERSLGQLPPSEAAEAGYHPGYAQPLYQKPYGKMAPGGYSYGVPSGAAKPMAPGPWGGAAPYPGSQPRPY